MQPMTYMFENNPEANEYGLDLLTGVGTLTTRMTGKHTALCTNKDETEYCFVYFDEAGLASIPYRTFQEAHNALVHYVHHCL